MAATSEFFLVEWYRSDLACAPVADTVALLDSGVTVVQAEGLPVRLLVAMAAPADDVLYALFSADSAAAVTLVCAQCGMPSDRITTGVDAQIACG